jgi:hypothetical protein
MVGPTKSATSRPRRGQGEAAYRLRVSNYDRTASLLISLLVLVGLFVVGLVIVYVTMQLIDRTVAVPISLADSGGRPADAAMGIARDLEPPGVEEAPELTEPTLPETLSALAEAAANTQAVFDEISVASETEAGRGSGLGDSRQAGLGGDGTAERVPRWERWRIRYIEVESLDNYSRQLDFFGIELAVLGKDNQVHYASDLSKKPPASRTGSPEDESRLYFAWKDGKLRRSDERLLDRAGIETAGRPILQVFPREVESMLLDLEQKQAGNRDVNEIRQTVFKVEAITDGFRFAVAQQLYL